MACISLSIDMYKSSLKLLKLQEVGWLFKLLLNTNLISASYWSVFWRSKKQPAVVLSSTEAVYIAFCAATCKSDPYVLFTLGNQVKKSKRNSQTSFWGPPGSPIWNQDFQFLVMNSKTEHLKVQVKDYFGFTSITIGVAEVDLTGFQDTVPVDKVIRLKGQWGPFDRRDVGEVLLQLTYIAYVEEDEDLEEKFECIPDSSTNGYSTDTDENDLDPMPLFKEVVNKAVETAEKETSVPNMLAAAIAELDEDNAKDRLTNKAFSNAGILEDAWDINNAKGNVRAADQTEIKDLRATLLWLALVTGVLLLVDRSVDFSNFMNP